MRKYTVLILAIIRGDIQHQADKHLIHGQSHSLNVEINVTYRSSSILLQVDCCLPIHCSGSWS